MIPIADDNSRRRTTPWVTYLLLVTNVAVFVSTALSTPFEQALTFARYAAVPALVTSDPTTWPTLLTCTFLHASWLHLGGNMLYLWVFGDNVEDALGHVRYLSFYLLAGVAGSVAQVLVDPSGTVPLVGASGAIAGVLAAYVVLFPRGMVRTIVVIVPPLFVWPVLPAWLLIGVWFLLQFWSGLTSLTGLAGGGVAYFAHVGGFVAGLVLARALARPERVRRGVDRRVRLVDPYEARRLERRRGTRW
ncbi:rhomboid family intramembrane serine protease [Cellulomonas marina]|uniref:Membrane associated serine protease, rhomboid family n=1 Tax=Cellulomonas marina TaxID=988821 RepID=A0A1I0Z407_9CELL|nr:rhomboid family intramembrane serine protease [Cellulomonas marina]GIG28169.1 rhomboid family intramembrane serine protease [Cellulomonas marina]SFB19330.1 Membrane associated serine protease, rhomboid family [Cellulomonas marina]